MGFAKYRVNKLRLLDYFMKGFVRNFESMRLISKFSFS